MFRIDKKQQNKVRNLYLLVLTIITFSILIHFLKNRTNKIPHEQRRYIYCQNEFNKKYSGVVLEKSKGRVGWGFKLNNETIFTPIVKCWKMGIQIEIKDSIYKPSNSFDLYIYKNANPDSVIYLPCEFDCNSLVEKD